MILNKMQRQIVTASEPKIVVLSAAASGKTEVLATRAKYLIERKYNPSKMVIITFTNAAAEVMRERIGEKGTNIFIGTIHSYCNYLLKSNGINTDDILNEEDFDQLFDRIQKYPEAIQEVDYLLLDEAQDSTQLEFEFLLDIINPKEFMLFGDVRQCIYEWRGAAPQLLISISRREDVTVYRMTENYRNGSAILTYSKNFIDLLGPDYEDDSISSSGRVGSVKELPFQMRKVSRIIKEQPEYGKWFVLLRNNNQLASVYNYLQGSGVPVDTFKRGDLTLEELREKMNDDTVKVLTVHAAKGLENNYVIVYGCDPTQTAEERRICYVAATRAKERLYWLYPAYNNKPKRSQVTSWE